jgi:hypothetical protein
MATKSYAHIGPPFDFLGNLSESQKGAFQTWVGAQLTTQPAVQLHHQIRAQQLRKTAGLLEQFYAMAATPLSAGFQKDAWQVGPDGHWAYAFRNDHIPAMVVSKIKQHLRPRLELQDDGVFHMKHLRNQIEKQEDLAQYAADSSAEIPKLQARLETLFAQPEFQAALVKDVSDTYEGEPRFRVHQLDPPTAWEKFQHNHSKQGDPLYLKG